MKTNYKFSKKNSYYEAGFISIFKIIIVSFFISIVTILRYILYEFPNIELVTFILMISVLFFTFRLSFLIINMAVFLQILFFGFSDLFYFYVFNIYGLVVYLFRTLIFKYWWMFIILMFIFGLLFGLLSSLQPLILYGPKVALYLWLSGIVFDAIHSSSNAIITCLLYLPILKVFLIFNEKYPFLFSSKFLAYEFK